MPDTLCRSLPAPTHALFYISQQRLPLYHIAIQQCCSHWSSALRTFMIPPHKFPPTTYLACLTFKHCLLYIVCCTTYTRKSCNNPQRASILLHVHARHVHTRDKCNRSSLLTLLFFLLIQYGVIQEEYDT